MFHKRHTYVVANKQLAEQDPREPREPSTRNDARGLRIPGRREICRAGDRTVEGPAT